MSHTLSMSLSPIFAGFIEQSISSILCLIEQTLAPSSTREIQQPLPPTPARVITQLCLHILWRLICHQPWHEKFILHFAFYLCRIELK